jgi:hypothetical protein
LGLPPSPLPYRSDQLCPPSLSFLPESPCAPRAHLIPESYSMTGCTSAPTSLPNLDTLVYGPISEQAYQEDNGALNSWSPHTTTAAIQQSTMDFSTTTVPIYEGSNHPATERQALWGVCCKSSWDCIFVFLELRRLRKASSRTWHHRCRSQEWKRRECR